MNKLKIGGIATLALGGLSSEEWLLLISIIITVLGMIQDYLKDHKTGDKDNGADTPS